LLPHPHASSQQPAKPSWPSVSALHVRTEPRHHALRAEAAATTASGFAEHHLGKASRAFSTTNLTQKICRLPAPMVVQRPPKGAPLTTERYCTNWRRCSSPSGLWHQYSSPGTVLPPCGGRTYHRLCAAHQGAARALCCQRRGLRPHPSHEAACQPENATKQARPRAWTVAPSGRWEVRSSPRELIFDFGQLSNELH
jgi:hypothetical protein